jgi:hypothetical protein
MLKKASKYLGIALAVITFGLAVAPSIFAWYDKTHIYILVEAVNLLRRIDKNRNVPEYEEIYSDKYMRRLFTGASDEDWVPPVRDNERSFRHYYDPDSPRAVKGVKFYRHYYLWIPLQGAHVKAPSRGYYEGTLRWVKDPNTGNIHNWPGAIGAYDYTESAKKEAYYRLGHVGHLLGDMADADHATNSPHAGSGYTLPEDLELMVGPKIWEAVDNLEFLGPLDKAMIKVTLSNLYSVIKNRLLAEGQQYTSYERLIEDHVDLSLVKDYMTEDEIKQRVRRSRVSNPLRPPIAGENIRKHETLDDFFNTMARRSKSAVAAAGLPLPLLLTDLAQYMTKYASVTTTGAILSFFLNEPVHIIPNLDTRDRETERKYLAFTWPLIKESVERNAGLMEHFFDIVNHPPYVREISMRQEGSSGFYTAGWKEKQAVRMLEWNNSNYRIVTGRELESKSAAFVPGEPIDITIGFGPLDANATKQIDPDSVLVTVGGEIVPGRLSDGCIWKGSYFPDELLEGETEKRLTVEIAARDMHHHFPREDLPDFGYELDSVPQTPAKAHFTYPYKWNGYENGTDMNHSIRIKPEKEEQEEPEQEETEEEDRDRVFPESQPRSMKYFVWMDRCGEGARRVHAGSEDEFKSKTRCRDEWLFGMSDEYVTKTQLAGPFDTMEEAVEAGCGVISGAFYRIVPGWGRVPYAKMGDGTCLIDDDLAAACIKED